VVHHDSHCGSLRRSFRNRTRSNVGQLAESNQRAKYFGSRGDDDFIFFVWLIYLQLGLGLSRLVVRVGSELLPVGLLLGHELHVLQDEDEEVA
jgi:hypothetical protein